jgi:glycosyltransferase involved in cell wall biosynthesis
MNMQKLPLSVAIITNNEEDNIGRTLESIADIASEIIIVDSGSTDDTLKIAEKYGCKIFKEEWKGYARQKNSALQKVSEPWILCLDADEEVTPELKSAIAEKISNPDADGYLLKRKTFYLGKLLNHSWQPDWKLRLFKRDSEPSWKGDIIHEGLEINGRVKKIDGFLIHYSFRNLKHHFDKTNDYARQSAMAYYEKGKNFHLINLLLNPPIAFIKIYLINLGFLDGLRGLLASMSHFLYTFLKYAFLWEICKSSRKNQN